MAETLSFDEIKYRKKEGKIMPRKPTLSQEVKKSIIMLMFTLLAIIILLSIVFLMNTSQFTQKGYVIQQGENDKENFLEENRNLIEKIIKAQAYETIQNAVASKKMQPPEKMTYVDEKHNAAPTGAKKTKK